MIDLERMRAAVAGMTPVAMPQHDNDTGPNDESYWEWWEVEGIRFNTEEAALRFVVLRNAAAIQQERHWTTRWVENRDGSGCWVAIDDANDKLLRDDDMPFTGSDAHTPLIEANAYMRERRR